MIDWMNYGKIQEYKRNGLKKSQAARRLGVDYKTILKYWDMSPAQYTEVEQASKKRRKKADEYKDFVVEYMKTDSVIMKTAAETMITNIHNLMNADNYDYTTPL